MGIRVACACGRSYDLKDELAGQEVRCPACGAVSRVGGAAPDAARFAGVDRAFARDRFLLRQKHLAISEKYYVWDEAGEVLLYVERPLHAIRNILAVLVATALLFAIAIFGIGMAAAITGGRGTGYGVLIMFVILLAIAAAAVVGTVLSAKRHVTFYRDDGKSERLLEVLQDRKWAPIVATFTVRDPEGRVLANLRKNFLYNLFRKQWEIREPSGAIRAIVKEDSILLSILRRLLGPLFGVLRTNFVFLRGESDAVIGEFNRKFTLLDRYVLDMSADPEGALDRRIAIAAGVMLDTAEKR